MLLGSAWRSSYFFIIRSMRSGSFNNTNFIITFVGLTFHDLLWYDRWENLWNVGCSRPFAVGALTSGAQRQYFRSKEFQWFWLPNCSYITLHCIAFHCVSFCFIALHCITSHLRRPSGFDYHIVLTLLCTALCFIAFHCASWRFIALLHILKDTPRVDVNQTDWELNTHEAKHKCLKTQFTVTYR